MRNFIVTIEGRKYEVSVEEVSAFKLQPQAPVAVPVQAAAPQQIAPQQAAPQQAAPQQVAPQQAPSTSGGVEIESPMPGLILELKFSQGASVKAGQTILVLEAMKMANDITAPCDGVISYSVQKGANVDTGAILATIA